jgi:hypothetical protein
MALTTVKNAGLTGSIDLTAKVTGTLPAANGGTGATSFSPGKVLQVSMVYSNASNTSTANESSALLTVGDTITMTPASSSSRFYLNWVSHMVAFNCQNATAMSLLTDFRRAISGGATTDDLLKDSSAGNLSYCWSYDGRSGGSLPRYFDPCITTTLLDSPSTTSDVSYTCMYSKNAWGGTTTDAAGFYEVGMFSVMEIGA